MKTVEFKVETDLKQRDGLTHKLCNVALQYVIRVKCRIFYKSLQLIGSAGDINTRHVFKVSSGEPLKITHKR